MGLDKYLEAYGQLDGCATLREHLEEFDDWQLTVPFASGSIRILCCPEDRQCSQDGCLQGKIVCQDCELPLCSECAASLAAAPPLMPAAALANDMMACYAPDILYRRKVTMLELVCSSVCLTSMVCFTLDRKTQA